MHKAENADLECNYSKNDRIKVVLDPIPKPSVIPATNPFVYIDSKSLYYTFDGRSLYFCKEQKQPIISVPEETIKFLLATHDNKNYYFSLTSKGRLECSECLSMNNGDNPEIMLDKKYNITRNVVSVQSTRHEIFYMFKKDSFYYINKCYFDGKKWMGKVVLHNIKGSSVELFATDGTFYYIKDGSLFNDLGEDLYMKAKFVHRHDNLIVVASKSDCGTEFKLFDMSFFLIESYEIPTDDICSMKGDCDVVALLINDKMLVLRFSEDGFCVKGFIEFEQSLICYDMLTSNSEVRIAALTHDLCEQQIYECKGDQISPKLSLMREETLKNRMVEEEQTILTDDSIEQSVQDMCHNDPVNPIVSAHPIVGESNTAASLDSEENEDSMPCKVSLADECNVVKDMNSMSLSSLNTSASLSKPKNKLLEEVKAMLNKRKQTVQNFSKSVSSLNDACNSELLSDEKSVKSECTSAETSKEKEVLSSFKTPLGFKNQSKGCKMNSSTGSPSKSTKFVHPGKEKQAASSSEESVPNSVESSIQSSLEEMNIFSEMCKQDLQSSVLADDISSNNQMRTNLQKPGDINAGYDIKRKDLSKKELCDIETSAVTDKSCEESNLKIQNMSNNCSYDEDAMGSSRARLDSTQRLLAEVKELISNYKKMESLVDNIVLKELVPIVEGCFNEMKIQMLSEIRKLSNIIPDYSGAKHGLIQKFIVSGKINQAMQEFAKMDDSDANSCIGIFANCNIENSDSNVLVTFLGRMSSLLRKSQKDVYFKAVSSALMDMEVSHLSVDNLQNLSMFLRHLKQITDPENEKFNHLNCIMDIIVKKIRRRVKVGGNFAKAKSEC